MSDSKNPLREAQQRFIDDLGRHRVDAETIALGTAPGRFLAGDLKAPEDSPPYARAIVEGYLVHQTTTAHATEAQPVSFDIVGEIHPGDARCPDFTAHQALRVNTGSLVPDGAYAIVRDFESSVSGKRLQVSRPFQPGFFIEARGCEYSRGTTVIADGSVLGARELGLIASFGLTDVSVSRKPAVTIFSSGDEVVPYNGTVKPGQIRDCNAVMLSAAVWEAGANPIFAGIMRDDFDAFVTAVQNALQTSDMILISGGTAIGGRDFISDLIKHVGDLVVDGVPMRSGRPLIMGLVGHKPIVCVAGHPPEALRGFQLFGVAALNRLMGRPVALPDDPNPPSSPPGKPG